MTQHQAAKIRQAIKETEAQLTRELGYSPELQNSKMVEFYKGHIRILHAALASGVLPANCAA